MPARPITARKRIGAAALDGRWPAMAAIAGDAPINLTRESNGEFAVELEFRIDAAPTADVSLMMQCRGQSARRLSGRQRVPGGGAKASGHASPFRCTALKRPAWT
jgi:hypothetical protein